MATCQLTDTALTTTLCAADKQDLAIEGMLTFLDPPKESAAKAIHALQDKGVAIKVLTGDSPIVTARICAVVESTAQTILTGAKIEAMSDPELKQAVEAHAVFARLMPLQKSRGLKMLQHNGHTVGFLSDGIYDAPAVREANVGISVDNVADIAKASSDVMLLEKDLMTLEQGMILGRETFGNIIKYLNMTASSKFGNIFLNWSPVPSSFSTHAGCYSSADTESNVCISQLSLRWDKMDREFLRKLRKWDAKNICRFMVWIRPTSSILISTPLR